MSHHSHHFVKLSAKHKDPVGFNTPKSQTLWTRYFGSVGAAKKYTTTWAETNRQPAPRWERLDRGRQHKGTIEGSQVYYKIKKCQITKLHPALQKLLDNF